MRVFGDRRAPILPARRTAQGSMQPIARRPPRASPGTRPAPPALRGKQLSKAPSRPPNRLASGKRGHGVQTSERSSSSRPEAFKKRSRKRRAGLPQLFITLASQPASMPPPDAPKEPFCGASSEKLIVDQRDKFCQRRMVGHNQWLPKPLLFQNPLGSTPPARPLAYSWIVPIGTPRKPSPASSVTVPLERIHQQNCSHCASGSRRIALNTVAAPIFVSISLDAVTSISASSASSTKTAASPNSLR